jgi:hypothetical protein
VTWLRIAPQRAAIGPAAFVATKPPAVAVERAPRSSANSRPAAVRLSTKALEPACAPRLSVLFVTASAIRNNIMYCGNDFDAEIERAISALDVEVIKVAVNEDAG